MNNPVTSAILAMVGILGFAFAIYSHIINKEHKELTYASKTNSLIHNQEKSFKKISVFYGDKSIENLYVSKIAIWNSGNKVLKETDFVKDLNLAITLEEGCEILETNIINYTEKTNAFNAVQTDNRKLTINFDYAEKKDGIVLQVIHTGLKNDINLSCKIIGGQPLKEYSKEKYGLSKKKNTFSKTFFGKLLSILMCVLYSILSVLMIFIGVWQIINPQNINPKTVEELHKNNSEINISFLITGIIFLLFTLFFFYTFIKKNYLGMPSKLKKAYEEESV
jgi:hypothetical protein